MKFLTVVVALILAAFAVPNRAAAQCASFNAFGVSAVGVPVVPAVGFNAFGFTTGFGTRAVGVAAIPVAGFNSFAVGVPAFGFNAFAVRGGFGVRGGLGRPAVIQNTVIRRGLFRNVVRQQTIIR